MKEGCFFRENESEIQEISRHVVKYCFYSIYPKVTRIRRGVPQNECCACAMWNPRRITLIFGYLGGISCADGCLERTIEWTCEWCESAKKWCLISCFVLTTKEKTGSFPPNRNDNSQLFPRCRQKFFSFDICEKHAHRVRFQWERGVTIREGRFAQYHSIFTSDGYYFVCTTMPE